MRKLFLITLIFLTSCASTPAGPAFTPSQAISTELATVYVYRRYTPPILRKPDILVNGQFVAELPTESYFVMHLQSGNYEIKTGWGIDGMILNRSTKISVLANNTYYVEVSNSVEFIGTTGVYSSSVSGQSLSEPPQAIRSCKLITSNHSDVLPQ